MNIGRHTTNREATQIELKKIRVEVNNGDMNQQVKNKLLDMLDTNIEGLTHVDWDDFCIKDTSIDLVYDYIITGFEMIQGALEAIDEDEHVNEWRCPFSNRVMHKSMKLNELKKGLVFAQKKIFESLGHLVPLPAQTLMEKIDDFKYEDFKFRVK